MLMSDFEKTPKSPKGGGWLPGEATMWLEGWNFQLHFLTSRTGREGFEIEFNHQ